MQRQLPQTGRVRKVRMSPGLQTDHHQFLCSSICKFTQNNWLLFDRRKKEKEERRQGIRLSFWNTGRGTASFRSRLPSSWYPSSWFRGSASRRFWRSCCAENCKYSCEWSAKWKLQFFSLQHMLRYFGSDKFGRIGWLVFWLLYPFLVEDWNSQSWEDVPVHGSLPPPRGSYATRLSFSVAKQRRNGTFTQHYRRSHWNPSILLWNWYTQWTFPANVGTNHYSGINH